MLSGNLPAQSRLGSSREGRVLLGQCNGQALHIIERAEEALGLRAGALIVLSLGGQSFRDHGRSAARRELTDGSLTLILLLGSFGLELPDGNFSRKRPE